MDSGKISDEYGHFKRGIVILEGSASGDEEENHS